MRPKVVITGPSASFSEFYSAPTTISPRWASTVCHLSRRNACFRLFAEREEFGTPVRLMCAGREVVA